MNNKSDIVVGQSSKRNSW